MLKRNLVTSLILYESVRTTRPRAKAISAMIDRLVRNARKQTPHNAIRSINQVVTDKNACRKVMQVLVKRYEERTSGLTTMKAVGVRQGDGAHLVDLTLMDAEIGSMFQEEEPKKKEAKAPKKTASPKPAAAEKKEEEPKEAAAKKPTAKKADSTKKKS